MGHSLKSITSYMASFNSGRPTLLVDPDMPADLLLGLAASYRAQLILGDSTMVLEPSPAIQGLPAQILLPTSGSTGSPRFVRLAPEAVMANASSIINALRIETHHIAPLNLPLFYSYGLSVLNSHLAAGATVMLPQQGILTKEFWLQFDQIGCTSLAGVPHTYRTLRRMRFDPARHPSLKMLTQAGGFLDIDHRTWFHDQMGRLGGEFVVMYGQTEASARMAVLPHDRFYEHERSAGWPIDGGSFRVVIDGHEEETPDVEGELFYHGPNVMLGYANSYEDLPSPDQMCGQLPTGDLGYVAADGAVYVTGRESRFAKVFGVRVSLDYVEAILAEYAIPSAAFESDDTLTVVIEGPNDVSRLQVEIAGHLRVNRSGVIVHAVQELPRLPSGKTDYRTLITQFS
jgi:acyl-coenzyme A synthetase/AMP-(fatty) acid ligase